MFAPRAARSPATAPPEAAADPARRRPAALDTAPAAPPAWDFAAIPLVPAAPPLVHAALRAPGTGLEAAMRTEMERRFGRDLGAVRLHTGPLAERSAHAVDARAYTVGRHIVFAAGQFAPDTAPGARLLRHELAHAVQQRDATLVDGAPLPLGGPHSAAEAEARRSEHGPADVRLRAPAEVQRDPPPGTVDVDIEQTPAPPGMNLPQVGGGTLSAIGGTPYATILPGYAQAGDSCGAASLVSALVIWDREHWKPAEPNSRIVTACNLTLIEFLRRGAAAVAGWTAHPTPGARQLAQTVPGATVGTVFSALRTKFTQDLQRIRDAGRQPGAKITETDYQTIGSALYFLWNLGSGNGLDAGAIAGIQSALGLEAAGPNVSSNVQSLDDIFSNSVVAGLQPDQIAQAGWFSGTGQQHAFLVGRLQGGEWFVSDQGTQPASEYRAPSLAMLQGSVTAAARGVNPPLYGGTVTDFLAAGGQLPGWLGVKRLAGPGGVAAKSEEIVAAGAFLGEVDAGALTIGDRITRGGFIGRAYALADAQAKLPPATSGGGLIVEAPSGVFSVYATSSVTKDNLTQTSLDADDSKDSALLTGRGTYSHAWLIPGTSSGTRGSWFPVF